MALTELIFGEKKKAEVGSSPLGGGVGIVQFDCTLSETHTDTAEITSHAVEEGADITDHIRKLPATVELNGLVTNTPIAFLASLFASPPTRSTASFIPSLPGSNRVDEAYSLLQQMMDDGIIMDVSTSLRDYSNMAIESMSVTRDANTGNALDCVLTLREVKKAKALSVDLPVPDEVGNNTSTNLGNTSTTSSTTSQNQVGSSVLNDFLF